MFNKSKRIRKTLGFILTIMLLTSVIIPIQPAVVNAVATSVPSTPLRILEVEPGPSYNIDAAMKNQLQTDLERTIELTQMPMPLFISKVDEINGYYDIVYIGNKTYTGDASTDPRPYFDRYGGNAYSQFGNTVANKPNYAVTLSNGKEFYPGTDITNRTANNLLRFVNSLQFTIFDQGIFTDSLKDTKLYKNFVTYKNNNTYKNFKVCTASTLLATLKTYQSVEANKKPTLTIKSAPTAYDGTSVAINNGTLNFVIGIKNNNDGGLMTVKLYLDNNGDGLFTSDERAYQSPTGIPDTESYNFSLTIPSDYTGVIPWKLELTDNHGVKTYQTGFTAHKGAVNIIKVLQLLPSNTTPTFKLSDLGNQIEGGHPVNLLKRDGEYEIQVTEMKINTFNSNYPNQARDINNNLKPTVLNGNYDMVVVGFCDSFASDSANDLSGAALNALYDFGVNSGQSIMFTHDTIGFTTAKRNLTDKFVNVLGLNAFNTDPTLKSGVTTSSGITRLALFNANYGTISGVANVDSRDQHFPDTIYTKKINDSALTRYPFLLGDITVSLTHLQYLRVDMEDPDTVVAYTYRNGDAYNHSAFAKFSPVRPEVLYHEYDGANDYYTLFRKNLTYSGTGHSTVNDINEMKMFVDTIFKAYKGSNHAPSVNIYDITNNMQILKTQPSITFKIDPYDPDSVDYDLTGNVYIDKNNNGSIDSGEYVAGVNPLSLNKGVTKTVTIDNPGLARFGIIAEVIDPHGAKGYKLISNIQNTDKPVINISTDNPTCLVNDEISIATPVTALATGTTINTSFTDMLLKQNINSTYFTIADLRDYSSAGSNNYTTSLQNVTFSPMPDRPNQSATIIVKAKDAGQNDISTTFTYKDNSDGSTQTRSATYTVKSRIGYVKVNVPNAASYPGLKVTLKKYTDSNCTTEVPGSATTLPVNAVTNSVTFEKMTTGYYAADYDYSSLAAGFPVPPGGSLTKAGSILDYSNDNITINLPSLFSGSVTVQSRNLDGSVRPNQGVRLKKFTSFGGSEDITFSLTGITSASGVITFNNLAPGFYGAEYIIGPNPNYSVKGVNLAYASNELVGTANSASITMPDVYSCTVSAKFLDIVGNPIVGANVELIKSGGIHTGITNTTGSNGIATFPVVVAAGDYGATYVSLPSGYTPVGDPITYKTFNDTKLSDEVIVPRIYKNVTIGINPLPAGTYKALSNIDLSFNVNSIYTGTQVRSATWEVLDLSDNPDSKLGTITNTGTTQARFIGKRSGTVIKVRVTVSIKIPDGTPTGLIVNNIVSPIYTLPNLNPKKVDIG